MCNDADLVARNRGLVSWCIAPGGEVVETLLKYGKAPHDQDETKLKKLA